MTDQDKPKRKVLNKKIWTIVKTEYSDNTSSLQRTNDGFSALELLGICQFSSIEILQQMAGTIKPDIISRKVTKETKS